MRGDDNDGEMDSKELKRNSWLKRLIGRTKKPMITWPFPFVEERFFVLTIRAGAEGYHINVDGQHITSFPYRTVCFYYLIVYVTFYLMDLLG